MVSEVRKGIRSGISSIGLQRMVEFPYSLIRHLKPSVSAKNLKENKAQHKTEPYESDAENS